MSLHALDNITRAPEDTSETCGSIAPGQHADPPGSGRMPDRSTVERQGTTTPGVRRTPFTWRAVLSTSLVTLAVTMVRTAENLLADAERGAESTTSVRDHLGRTAALGPERWQHEDGSRKFEDPDVQ